VLKIVFNRRLDLCVLAKIDFHTPYIELDFSKNSNRIRMVPAIIFFFFLRVVSRCCFKFEFDDRRATALSLETLLLSIRFLQIYFTLFELRDFFLT
jgi:hypothetical protein